MTDWYVSSAAYAAIPVFQATHAYNVGDIIKPTAPAQRSLWVFRCTVAGTSTTEPNWNGATGINNTITSGPVTFINVTGVSTYGWNSATGDFLTLTGVTAQTRFGAGDRVFISSDHSENQGGGVYGSGQSGGTGYSSSQVLCVNRAGSVPPVPADLTTGATITVSGNNTLYFESFFPIYHYGITYINTGPNNIQFNSGSYKTNYFDTCQLYLNTVNAGSRIADNNPCSFILYNSTMQFGHVAQTITCGYPMEIIWLNTPNAIAGTIIPTVLFSQSQPLTVTARGVDFSAVTGTLVQNGNYGSKFLFDSCLIAPTVVRYSAINVGNTRDQVDLVNCFDGTNFISETYQPCGAVTTEFSITLSGGARDNVGVYSHKMVTNPNVDKIVQPLCGFWIDCNYTTIGGTRTATVEIISSGSLNTDDIALFVEYQGTAGSSIASINDSFPATPFTAITAVNSSTATWNNSPTTPVRQKLQVSFTPMVAGAVRAQVRLGKSSTTVYYNPQVTIT